MDIPKSQEKLTIRKFSNKKRTQGQSSHFYEVRDYDNRYIGDIYFLEYNNRWYLHGAGGFMLSTNELDELNTFINKLSVKKSIYK